MIVQFTDAISGETTRVKVQLIQDLTASLLLSDTGKTYGYRDWHVMGGRVIFAAQHERRRMPIWMRMQRMSEAQVKLIEDFDMPSCGL